MQILITYFAPFGAFTKNPTEDIAKALQSRNIDTLLLPVSFAHSFDSLQKAMENKHYGLVLLLGLHGATSSVLLEMVAHNIQHASIADNDGAQPKQCPIVENGSLSYHTGLNFWELLQGLQAQGLPVQASSSAGTYVCNCTYYKCLHYINSKGLSTHAMFIHVPCTEDMGKEPNMPLAQEIACVQAVIDALQA